MTCAKQRVRVTLTHPDGRSWAGENRCRNPQPACPRLPGEGYEKCRTVCDQVGHAELDALNAAGEHARGCTASLDGHTYYCMECQHALYAAGVVALRAPGTVGVMAAPAPRYLTAEECHELAETVGLGSVTVQRKFCEVNGLPQPVVRSAGMGEREPTEAELVCYEAYQVVGSLLSDLGKFDTPEAEKILDNLSQAKLVHKDVLPWESYAPTGVKGADECKS